MAPTKQGGKAQAIQAQAIHSPSVAASEASDGIHKVTRKCLLNQLHKTKLCIYHQKGTCQHGKECAFAHSEAELQSTPDLSNTRLCVTFQQTGECLDRSCRFAHSEEQLRSTAMFYRKTLCIWHQKGRCRNGDQCRFAHGRTQLMQPMGAQPARSALGQANQKGPPKMVAKAARAAGHGPPAAVPPVEGRGGLRHEPMKVPMPMPGDEHPAFSMPPGLMQQSAELSAGACQLMQQSVDMGAADGLHEQLVNLSKQLSVLTERCSQLSRGRPGMEEFGPRAYPASDLSGSVPGSSPSAGSRGAYGGPKVDLDLLTYSLIDRNARAANQWPSLDSQGLYEQI